MARRKPETFFDYTLIFVVLFLLGFGLIMIYSTSSYEGMKLDNPDPAYYLRSQLFATILGLIGMIIVANVPYHFWERFAMLAYIASVALILLIIPFGVERGGAKRWLIIAGISLQPAEVAKLGVILFLASVINRMDKKKIRTVKGFFFILLIPLPISLMIWQITNNASSAVIVFGIALVMLFVASPDYKKFILLGAGGAAAASAAVATIIGLAQKGEAEGVGFRGGRILAWLNPEAYAADRAFQPLQALYAIGSGGILGKGLGQSMQKLGFLPESQNDMIFAIICEELGLFGGIAIILMYLLLIWRFMFIATNTNDLFGALLVVGVMGHIAIQVFLNIAVVTSTIPNTGISLPFISYGGSSALFLLAEIGLVLSVAKSIRLKDI